MPQCNGPNYKQDSAEWRLLVDYDDDNEEKTVLSNSFTQIYILFQIYVCIGPPKMHRRFHIDLPKMYRRFHIGPPQVSLNLLPQKSHSQGNMLTMAILKERQRNNLFEIEWPVPFS